MTGFAFELATWAAGHRAGPDDIELAHRSLLDTVGVAVAGRDEPAVRHAAVLHEAGRWATAAHVLDYDDLHLSSTTHISAVCVPAALACGGGPQVYLAGAGVMARVGAALGWRHYSAGWHATCTAGAPAAAVCAGVALGLDAPRLAIAIALAVPAAGGVQRAFGSDAKSLQVGFAVDAGVRAARLAASGASADPRAFDDWLDLVAAGGERVVDASPAIPGGLAVKLYPCCYALQRPIGALSRIREQAIDPERIESVLVRTPAATVTPLIHDRPRTGLQAKFSMQYAVAAALIDGHPGLQSFTDEAAARSEVRRLLPRVQVELLDGGDGLLDGEFVALVDLGSETLTVRERLPEGSPERPPSAEALHRKLDDCMAGSGVAAEDVTWESAAAILRRLIG